MERKASRGMWVRAALLMFPGFKREAGTVSPKPFPGGPRSGANSDITLKNRWGQPEAYTEHRAMGRDKRKENDAKPPFIINF